jgi:hypothetical protein
MNRRGMTLMELAVAGVLLTALLTISAQIMTATAAQRRIADQRRLAVFEAANVMERMAAHAWTDLTPEAVAGQQIPTSARKRLPGAELKVEVSSPPADPGAKRLLVSLRWQDDHGRFLSPVTLVTWKYK